VDAVVRSLAAFGQQKPIVVRRADHVVVAGNHTLAAARELGWDTLAVSWVDMDDITAKAYALADNRTADLGGYDDAALVAMLTDVQMDPELFGATGFSQDDYDELAGNVAFDPVATTARLDQRPEVTCPECGAEFVPE
jgi:hypothetical protein